MSCIDILRRTPALSVLAVLAMVFEAVPRGDVMSAQLEARFNEERESEWAEYLAECTKFEREIDKEIRIEKFTAAELDEEEQNLERLRRWFREPT